MSIRHVIERARQRYGLELVHEDCMAIIVLIAKGQAELVPFVVVDKRSEAWRVVFRGRELTAVTMRRDDGRYVLRTIFPAHTCQESGFKLGQVVRRKEKT